MGNKRITKKEGDIFYIKLSDYSYSYGRILKDPYYAFYDLKTDMITNDLQTIIQAKILFKLAVMKYAFSLNQINQWQITGNIPLNDDLKTPPVFFGGGGNNFYLAFWDGTTQPSTYEL